MAHLGQALAGCPEDGVTAVRFNESGELLLASSWDGVRQPCTCAQQACAQASDTPWSAGRARV